MPGAVVAVTKGYEPSVKLHWNEAAREAWTGVSGRTPPCRLAQPPGDIDKSLPGEEHRGKLSETSDNTSTGILQNISIYLNS